MARERGATRFLSNGCASRSRVAVLVAIWSSTTGADRIPRLAGKRPIKPMATSQSQSRQRHNQSGDPLIDSSQTVQIDEPPLKAEDDEKRIRSWASNVFENNFAVARLAKALISMALYRDPLRSLEDYWEEELGRVVELGEFRSRADQALRDENLSDEDRDVLQKFLKECQSEETGNNDNGSRS